MESVESAEARRVRERLAWLAWLLDGSIPLPGTRFTIGVEALIGLVPVLGDLIGFFLSSYILGEAARLGVPRSVLARMALNVGLEGLAGMVPLAGDVFDAAFKANQRNVRLLDGWLAAPRRTERSSRWLVVGLVAALGGVLALAGVAGFLLVRWIAHAL